MTGLSEQSNSSPHVLREVERISSDGKPLFVLRVDPVQLSDRAFRRLNC